MCASCSCGCKPGKPDKGCKCTCKMCREARAMSVEKSFLVSKALRGFDEIEKGFYNKKEVRAQIDALKKIAMHPASVVAARRKGPAPKRFGGDSSAGGRYKYKDID